METLWGWHPVREALRARRRTLHRLSIREGARHTEEARALADSAGIPVETESAKAFDHGLPEEIRAQGLSLQVDALPEYPLETLIERGEVGQRCVVALDGVEDPQNAGAIVRSADGAGAFALLLTQRRAPPLSPAMSRASAGALEHLPVARMPNLARSLDLLKSQGFWILGADSNEGEDLYETPDRIWAGDLVIVLGAEGKGLRPGVAAKLDHRIRIPMAGAVGSLNVSAAGSLILFERLRRTR
jgi:23S rRNA (guanosine2251-2'-O)-methyltransferase